MEYKVINLDYLNEVADGDREFVLDLIQAFLQLGPEDIEELNTASAEKNWREVSRIVHKLKSAAESMGVQKMSEMAAEVEFTLRANEYRGDDRTAELVTRICETFYLAREEFLFELEREV
ncbi:MAG: Hpt domain-containing protein [Bacteroidota bacterium]